MISLYRKAETLRREDKLLRLIRHDIAPSRDDFDIPVREEEDILDHLDDLVIKKKISVTDSTFSFKSQKKDMVFPVMVNTIILGVVVLGILAFTYFSGAAEDNIISGSGELLSTEGRLIAKLRQDTEAQLKQKDIEITETRERLDQINTEYSRLQEDMEDRIRSRENELNEELSRKLAEERLKLQQEGLPAAEIDRRLRQLEADKDQEFRQQMDSFILKAETELKEKEDSLSAMQSEYELILLDKQAEQTALKEEMERRQSEIAEQLGSRLREAETAESEISEKLSSLTARQQEQQLVLDQIDGFYRQIRAELAKPDYEAALKKLDALESYITGGPASAVTAVAERSPVELFKIESIRKLIEREAAQLNSEAEPPPPEVLALERVSSMVDEADALFEEGRTEDAAGLYLRAFGEIPELSRSHEKLMELSAVAAGKDRKALEDSLRRIRNQLADAESRLKVAENQLADTGKRLAESEAGVSVTSAYAANLTRRIDAARQAIAGSSPGSGTEYSQDEMLELLQSKILMKQILNSEEVKADHPGLYEDLENYFTAYGDLKLEEGRTDAINALITVIGAIGDSEPDMDELISERIPVGEREKALYLSLLGELREMIAAID